MTPVLNVDNLKTSFFTKAGEVQAVRGVSFGVNRGEILGVVGESGSGKSVTSLSILRLLPDNAKSKEGTITYDGQNLMEMNSKQIRSVRGNKISMIFQDPMTSLNPLMTIGKQVSESILEHNNSMSKQQAKDLALDFLKKVHIPDAERRYNAYPHELSGGMRQRVMIAIAISCSPELLIADEPTTALDVTIQDQILMLLKQMKNDMNLSVMLITHDLSVVAETCDRVLVMYGGLIMEQAVVEELFYNPSHPYTMGLLDSVPKLNQTKNEKLLPIAGSPPDMLHPPKGCPFCTRCKWARQICLDKLPPYTEITNTHKSMCWLLLPEAPKENNPFYKGGK